MINFIVGIISVMAAGLVVVWITRPSFRKWIEQPKYTVLENDRRFKETKQEDNC